MARRFDLFAYLKLFRYPFVFTAIADSATGYLICTGLNEINGLTMGLLAVASAGLTSSAWPSTTSPTGTGTWRSRPPGSSPRDDCR